MYGLLVTEKCHYRFSVSSSSIGFVSCILNICSKVPIPLELLSAWVIGSSFVIFFSIPRNITCSDVYLSDVNTALQLFFFWLLLTWNIFLHSFTFILPLSFYLKWFSFFKYYWCIVDLQCCLSFRCSAKWFRYMCVCMHIYILFQVLFVIGYYKILSETFLVFIYMCKINYRDNW